MHIEGQSTITEIILKLSENQRDLFSVISAIYSHK